MYQREGRKESLEPHSELKIAWYNDTMIRLFLALLASLLFLRSPLFAAECDPTCGNAIECRDKIAKCQEAWNSMQAAKQPHVDSLRKMESEIAAFQARIKTIEGDVTKKAKAIAEGEKELSGLLDTAALRIRSLYIRNAGYNQLQSLFSPQNDVTLALRQRAYSQAVINEDKRSIAKTAISVRDLQDKKEGLEKAPRTKR